MPVAAVGPRLVDVTLSITAGEGAGRRNQDKTKTHHVYYYCNQGNCKQV